MFLGYLHSKNVFSKPTHFEKDTRGHCETRNKFSHPLSKVALKGGKKENLFTADRSDLA